MSKKYLFLSFFLGLLSILLIPALTKAVCPICTIAVGAGVGLCRWLGIDDLISGVWVGGLIVSLILWTSNWLNKKNVKFKFRWLVISALYYVIVIVPLYWTNVMGHPLNKFWKIDKLLFGIIVGSIVFLLSTMLNGYLKKRNNDKAYFPFQKVVFPVVGLLIISLIFYFTC